MIKKVIGVFVLSVIILACDAQDMKVSEMSMCKSVEKSTPIDVADQFDSNIGTLFCFTKISAPSGSGEIYHVWYQNDVEKLKIELKIKGTSWRTYSKKTLNEGSKGDWRVDVITADGKVLESKKFTIK